MAVKSAKPKPVGIKAAIAFLEGRGYQITRDEYQPPDTVHDLGWYDGEKVELGLISDTHLGSKYQQLAHLIRAYNYFKKRGIKDVLHGGDLCDGYRVYRGQEHEVFLHGADAQVDYAVEKYPRVGGITTHIITGNHDESFIKWDGFDLVKAVCKERNDIRYIDRLGGRLLINGLKIDLLHPGGSVPYARSYRGQKVVEQLASETKPNILLIGHYHVTNVLPIYRNILTVNLFCFQSQTPYLKRKGLNPDVGFYILTLWTKTKNDTVRRGIVRVSLEWFPEYKMIPNDF